MALREIVQSASCAVIGVALLFLFHEWRPARNFEVARISDPDGRKVLRVGFFPTITHAQALIGLSNGAFRNALGPGVEVEAYPFSAGPAAVEALFGGSIDLAYVGPNPAINAYVRSRGGAARILAGGSSGGAALVVHGEISDFRGQKLATPQLGNSQDVAARSWLRSQGLLPGRDVEVIPLKNPDQFSLFLRKEIHAAWTVEPWVSRMVREGGGKVFLDERSLWPGGAFASTVLLVNTRFLRDHPDLIRKWLRAHVEITREIVAHPEKARQAVNAELARIAGKGLREDVLADAFSRVAFTWDPLTGSIQESARRAFEEGFLGKTKPDLSGIQDLRLLNDVLQELGLEGVK
jgi:NitT/TauT family transport system substrate-binding protein